MKKQTIIIIVLVLLHLAEGASSLSVLSYTYVDDFYPDTNFYGVSPMPLGYTYDEYQTAYQQTGLFVVDSSGTFTFICSGDCTQTEFTVGYTTAFDSSTVTYNSYEGYNSISACEYMPGIVGENTCIIPPDLSNYLVVLSEPLDGVTIVYVSADSDTTPPNSISGLTNTKSYNWIRWMWTNPSDEDFDYSEIRINNIFITNTSSEYYNLTGLTYRDTRTISIRAVDTTGNINLTEVTQTTQTLPPMYNMSTPTIDGQSLKSVYSVPVNLWDNPYFVWGNYVYTNTTTKKECLYKGNNVFACDLLPGVYTFNMSYSSFEDYNSTSSIFYTQNIHLGNGTTKNFNADKMNILTREKTLKEESYTYLYIIFLIIIIIGLASFGKGNKDYDRR
jgi:hypothetical protein